jgi:hypothetical protein
MVPLRFVVACAEGHVEDFPWVEWTHRVKGEKLSREVTCADPKLRLLTTGASGLDGLLVKCETCNSFQSMALAAGGTALRDLGCSANRPWLGPAGRDPAGCKANVMRVLQRGASNVYFANVESSILIPPFTSRARMILEDTAIWRQITDESFGSLVKRIEFLSDAKKVAPEDLRRAYEEKMKSPPESPEDSESEDDYRHAEYRALLDRSRPFQDDLRAVHLSGGAFEPGLAPYLDEVVLVEKLAETRALTGFSRITPDLAAAAAIPKLGQLSLSPRQTWLPAIRVYGEGIFITLVRDKLAEWAATNLARPAQLAQRHVEAARRRGRTAVLLPPTFFVLHTIAHLLIRRLSFECGYGSSSLRERIYCRESGSKPPMAGILIYTAAGDSEGTMGGLVQQGRPGRLEDILRAALGDARWCSSDPLCMETTAQGTDSLNMAACHACALVPETSCETGNRLLDRQCVVGTPADPEQGFMGTWSEL